MKDPYCHYLSYRPHFSTPAWGNKANFPAQFVDSINQHDHLSAPSDFGNYDTGRNSVNKERYVQAPKRTRSPVQYDDLDDFTEDPVTVQTESKRYCRLCRFLALVTASYSVLFFCEYLCSLVGVSVKAFIFGPRILFL